LIYILRDSELPEIVCKCSVMVCCRVTVSAFHWRDCKKSRRNCYIVVFRVRPLYTMVLLPLPQRQGQNIHPVRQYLRTVWCCIPENRNQMLCRKFNASHHIHFHR